MNKQHIFSNKVAFKEWEEAEKECGESKEEHLMYLYNVSNGI